MAAAAAAVSVAAGSDCCWPWQPVVCLFVRMSVGDARKGEVSKTLNSCPAGGLNDETDG